MKMKSQTSCWMSTPTSPSTTFPDASVALVFLIKLCIRKITKHFSPKDEERQEIKGLLKTASKELLISELSHSKRETQNILLLQT